MKSEHNNCKLIRGKDELVAEALVVDLTLHRKAITSPESTVLWRGLIRTTQSIAVSAGDMLTLKIPNMEERFIEILESPNPVDNSVPFRGMNSVPIPTSDDEQ
jgi:hypothetical protein